MYFFQINLAQSEVKLAELNKTQLNKTKMELPLKLIWLFDLTASQAPPSSKMELPLKLIWLF